MKKRHGSAVLFAFLAGGALMLAGCVSNKGVYDPSVPPEQLCTLRIDSTLNVLQFDGNAVKWYTPQFSLANSMVIQIPAGYHEFIMNYTSGGSRYTFWADNIRYSYTFEAGKSYAMDAIRSNGMVHIEVEIKE
jgi:hypothetical protein